MTNPPDDLVRSRQRRATRITAALLFAFIALTFFITIAKLTVNR